jgi:hypothetical protein
MAEERQKSEWQRSSALMALIANVNRDPKHRPFSPDDFSPYASNAADRDAITLDRAEAVALFRQIAQAAKR